MIFRVIHHYDQFRQTKGRVMNLPLPGRLLVVVAALPGLALMLLSAIVFVVSLLALLLLTVPVYRLASFVSGALPKRRETVIGEEVDEIEPQIVESAPPPGPRRHVEVKIIES